MSARRHVANAVTVTRIVLTPVFLYSVWQASREGPSWGAAAVYSLVAFTDSLDGWLARWLGSSSRIGRLLDHGADITFLLAALALYAAIGLVPWWVPASIGMSFLVYVVDSSPGRGSERSGIELRGTWIGHSGGVLNYVLVGVLVIDRSAGLGVLPDAVLTVFCALVPFYSGAAVLQRLAARRRRSGAFLRAG